MGNLNTKYAELIRQAPQAKGRKEEVGSLHKAAKLKAKFDSNELMRSDIDHKQLLPCKTHFLFCCH